MRKDNADVRNSGRALSFEGSARRVTPELGTAMRDAVAHRGPDGTGLWLEPDGSVGLGFRRLAIIDRSDAANQPMANEDASLQLVYNGEIYNHADIRRELEARDRHRWVTDHSDSEVILHAFEEWGIDCVHRFRGMFAFAIWDRRERTHWLARDRIGIKPLYYSIRNGRLTFASEIKALLADPQQPRAIDKEALYLYLSLLMTPAPRTLFKGIRKLPPATWLRIDSDGRVREQHPFCASLPKVAHHRYLCDARDSNPRQGPYVAGADNYHGVGNDSSRPTESSPELAKRATSKSEEASFEPGNDSLDRLTEAAI